MKALKEIKQYRDYVLLHFEDDTVMKFVAEPDYTGMATLEEVEADPGDRLALGLISLEAFEAWRESKHREAINKHANEALIKAWEEYNRYGTQSGFSKPCLLPTQVAEQAAEIDWSKSATLEKMITFRGLNYILTRPEAK